MMKIQRYEDFDLRWGGFNNLRLLFLYHKIIFLFSLIYIQSPQHASPPTTFVSLFKTAEIIFNKFNTRDFYRATSKPKQHENDTKENFLVAFWWCSSSNGFKFFICLILIEYIYLFIFVKKLFSMTFF